VGALINVPPAFSADGEQDDKVTTKNSNNDSRIIFSPRIRYLIAIIMPEDLCLNIEDIVGDLDS
jgi:hypothetical protein